MAEIQERKEEREAKIKLAEIEQESKIKLAEIELQKEELALRRAALERGLG